MYLGIIIWLKQPAYLPPKLVLISENFTINLVLLKKSMWGYVYILQIWRD